MRNALETAVSQHYARPGLTRAIEQGLAVRSPADGPLVPADLAPVDEFHTAGRAATLRALEHFPARPGMHVLDAGAGLGGTARLLATEHGCRVTGIDLTPDFVAAAQALTERLGLGQRCRFSVGSVLQMPFDAASFDAALSFHAAMNVAERDVFYAELARVLRPGAPLCLYDVMRGPVSGMRYPVPWAETTTTSFLASRDETVVLAEAAGFEFVVEENLREFALEYFREQSAKPASPNASAALGLSLLTGSNTAEKFSNYASNLEANHCEPVVLVLRRR